MTLKKTAWAMAVATTLAITSLSAHADKKAVVEKILNLQQSALEEMSRNVAEQPARQLAGGARQILIQAIAEDKREATAKQVDAEIKKYLDAAVPVVRASVNKLSASVLSPIYEEKFTEDELKQLYAMLDSPVLKRYQSLSSEMTNALLEKVIADARPQVTPKLQAAESNIRAILDKAANASKPATEPKPAGKPAAKK